MNSIGTTITMLPVITGSPEGFTLISPAKLESLATTIATEIESSFECFFTTGDEIEQVKKDIDASSRHIEELNSRIEEANRHILESERRIGESAERIEGSEGRLHVLHNQNEELTKQKAELVRKRAELISKNEFLESELAKSNQRIADGEARIALGKQLDERSDRKMLEAAEHGKLADEARRRAAQGKENVAKLRAEIAAERAEIAAERTEIAASRERTAQLRASGTEKLITGTCRHFFRAFHGASAPELSKEAVSTLFSNYFPIEELSVEKDPTTQKPVILVNDSTPFVEYSRANPTLSKCVFTAFTVKEKRNIQAFADYLASPDCPITTITISSKFPLEVRQCLNVAKVQRKGALKICLPPSASVPKPPATDPSMSSSSSSSTD